MISFPGPNVFDTADCILMDVIASFLTDGAASPMSQRFVELQYPLASSVQYQEREFYKTAWSFELSGVPIDCGDGMSSDGELDGSDTSTQSSEGDESSQISTDEVDETEKAFEEGFMLKEFLSVIDKVRAKIPAETPPHSERY